MSPQEQALDTAYDLALLGENPSGPYKALHAEIRHVLAERKQDH